MIVADKNCKHGKEIKGPQKGNNSQMSGCKWEIL